MTNPDDRWLRTITAAIMLLKKIRELIATLYDLIRKVIDFLN